MIALPPSLGAVANAFYLAAAGLGLPSASLLLLYALYQVQRWLAPASPTTSFPKNPDAILMMLQGMTRVIGGASTALSRAAQFIFEGAAVVSTFALVLAALFFVIGRGLHDHQTWARGLAGAFAGTLLVVTVLLVTTLRGPLLLLSAILAVASFGAVWSLWRGFVT